MSCSTVDLPGPTVGAPLWVWGVGIVHSTTTFHRFISATNTMWLEIATATTIRQVCGANGNVITYTPGTAARWIAKFVGATADSFKWGAASAVTGTTSANGNPASGVWIGAQNDTAGTFTSLTLGANGIRNTELSGADLTAQEAWGTTNYGAGPF